MVTSLQESNKFNNLDVFEGIEGGVYHLIDSLPKFMEFYKLAKEQSLLCVDTETSSLNWHVCDLAGISIGWDGEHCYYIPVGHKTNELQLDLEDIRPYINEILGFPNKQYYLHHAKYDCHVLRKHGIEIKGIIQDTLIIYHLLDENVSHGLKDAAVRFIHKDADKWEKIIDEWRHNEAKRRKKAWMELVKEETNKSLQDPDLVTKLDKEFKDPKELKAFVKKLKEQELKNHPLAQRNKKDEVSYDYIPLNLMTPYACADVHYTYRLYKRLVPDLLKDEGLVELYNNELKLLKLLIEVEEYGMKIDVNYLKTLGPQLESEITASKSRLFQHIGYEFDVESPKEVLLALQNMNIPLTKLTNKSKEKVKSGSYEDLQYAVDKDVLEKLSIKHSFANDLLDCRKALKLKSTYVDGLIRAADSNGFVHTNFNQNVRTGRFSSSNPNLTNLPTSNTTIKRAFVPPNDNYVIVSIDFSQIELRLLAHYSQDPLLMSCYPKEGKGVDVHLLTTSNTILHKPIEELEKLLENKTGHVDNAENKTKLCECGACFVSRARRVAKVVVFGIVYGITQEGLHRKASLPGYPIPLEMCQEYIDNFLQTYRGVKNLIWEVTRFVKKHGYIQNSFNRYRRFPGIKNMYRWQVDRVVRQAVNYICQGNAADVFKTSAIRIDEFLKNKKSGIRLLNFLHDELIFYIPKNELELVPKIKTLMEDFEFTVPIVAEVSYAPKNWADKSKELKL